MAIVVQPAGAVKAFAALGQLVAQARAGEEAARQAERAADRAARLQAQLLAQQHQRELLEYRAQLDLEAQIEAERRARAWQIEKMEIASRLDFQREEQRYQRYQAEKEAKLEALDKAYKKGLISSEDYNRAVLETTTEIPFYTIAGRKSGTAEDPLMQLLGEGELASVPTPQELMAEGTPEAFRRGVELGYWEGETEEAPVDIEAMEDKQRYLRYFYNAKYTGKTPLTYAQWIAAGRPEVKVYSPWAWREDYKRMSETERRAIGR